MRRNTCGKVKRRNGIKRFCDLFDNQNKPRKEKNRNSEAGNRTPVVRVTGGNTKPLYYFGSVLEKQIDYLK